MADHNATSCGHHLDLAMVQLKKRELHCTSPVIKMSQFSQLKVNNDAWCSPGFYTHTCGYKMCLCVYVNGHGVGKGTHVSVYLYLMKGENDDALTWPIRYKSTVTLLNQLKDDHHFTITVNSKHEDSNRANMRVLSNEKATLGWGRPTFIVQPKLDLQEVKKSQYLKDDSLYFRVQVDLIPTVKPWLVPTLPS